MPETQSKRLSPSTVLLSVNLSLSFLAIPRGGGESLRNWVDSRRLAKEREMSEIFEGSRKEERVILEVVEGLRSGRGPIPPASPQSFLDVGQRTSPFYVIWNTGRKVFINTCQRRGQEEGSQTPTA